MGPENRRRETARVVRLQYASRAIRTTRGRKIRYGVICMTINIRGLSLLASRIVSPPYDDQENFVGLCLPRIPFSTDQRVHFQQSVVELCRYESFPNKVKVIDNT